ncbi:MAG TPA: ABC transporter permease, partial [Gemmatimonadaceae bacterium]|nr:ABC transporter permease [Gemmatimonadaceae bacterium]
MIRLLRVALARVRGLVMRSSADARADAELREEMEGHLAMAAAEYVRRGHAPNDARRLALLESGGVTQALEAVRDQRGLPWIDGVARDIRYACRALRHAPVFSLVVVLTLALGIGANTAIFSVVRGVLLKPLPHREGDRLLYLRQSSDGAGGENVRFSVPEVRDFRSAVTSLGGIAEYASWFGTLQGEHDVLRLDLGLVTGNFFEVMGLSPVLGRLTLPGDDGADAPPVMVLTHDLWVTRFGADSGIVGRELRLDGEPVRVIGVLQPAPFFPDRVDAIANMVVSPHHLSEQMIEGRSHRMTEMVARLAPGATLEQARTEVADVYARLQARHREAYDPGAHYRLVVLPFTEALGERARLTLWLLVGAAAFVMLIAAANVANLTLMRGVHRQHELVLRAALGAGVSRLRRLVFMEHLVLTISGAMLGVAMAVGGLGLLVSLVARYSPRASEIRLDWAALGFALGLSVTVALILSLLAVLPRDGARIALLAAGVRRVNATLGRLRLQRALVVAQVAVSVVLLAGAGLLTRTTMQLADVSTGLRTEEVLTIPVPLLNPARVSRELDVANKALYARMQREIRALPGVVEVGLGSTMPLRSSMLDFDIKGEFQPLAAGEATPHAELRTASPEYFRAAGIPLRRGREFNATDRAGATRVVIVNQTLADRFFPGADPIGKRIACTGEVLPFTPFSDAWRTIVGVVANTQDGGLDAEPRAVAFAPFAQEFSMLGGLVIRADSNASGLADAATRIVRSIAPA